MPSDLLFTHVTAAAVFVMVLQTLKKAEWFPWIQETGQTWLKRATSIAYAVGAHTGITAVWNPSSHGAGWHTLTFTIPSGMVILTTLWHMTGQYSLQEMIYQATGNRPAAQNPQPSVDSAPTKV